MVSRCGQAVPRELYLWCCRECYERSCSWTEEGCGTVVRVLISQIQKHFVVEVYSVLIDADLDMDARSSATRVFCKSALNGIVLHTAVRLENTQAGSEYSE